MHGSLVSGGCPQLIDKLQVNNAASNPLEMSLYEWMLQFQTLHFNLQSLAMDMSTGVNHSEIVQSR